MAAGTPGKIPTAVKLRAIQPEPSRATEGTRDRPAAVFPPAVGAFNSNPFFILILSATGREPAITSPPENLQMQETATPTQTLDAPAALRR